MPSRSRKSIVSKSPVPIINSNTAGIDIGAAELYVAVPSDRDEKPVRCFKSFTEDLLALVQWLKRCGIGSIAMESTGVYWIPVFQILEEHGFEVCLVNARHVKNVPGRKSDVSDCQWLQYLHSVGLLRGSFRPPQQICAVRAIVRHRDALVKLVNVHIQHMQKAMIQMNLQLHHVISDITGVTGLAIVDAILGGERNPDTLAAYRDPRIKASQETVRKSLVGDYRLEHLFTLRQSLQTYRHYEQQIADCDEQIKIMLSEFDSHVDPQTRPLPLPSKPLRKKDDPLQIREELYRLAGVDLTAIPGLQPITVYTLLSEIGTDVSKFPSDKHFASWLGLCPHNRISGGRILSSKTTPSANRAAAALRVAASTLIRNQTPLGDFCRRMRAKIGAPEAITATAHKLARIVYHLLKTKNPYDSTRFSQYDEQHRRRTEKRLKSQAKALGFTLVPT